ncbi:MAG: amidohydrolase [Clostridia bacterium]|nr:amidohydrolase [Clostridia bacterium]
MAILFKNAKLLPEYGFGKDSVYVSVRDGKIGEMSRTQPAGDFARVIDCRGNLLMPAFYNAHCHSAMTLFRGYGEDLPLKRWLDEKILPAEDRLNFINTYYGSKLAIAEMIRCGVVSFSDMYMFEDATAQAVLETGIKANLSRCIVSFGEDFDMASDRRVSEALRLAEDYQGAGDGRIVVDLSLHAEYTNNDACVRQIAEYGAANGYRMQLHLSETEREVEKCVERHGVSPVRYFHDMGIFSMPTTAAHCVFADGEDMEILKEDSVFVAHCPVSNLKLGSGVMPLKEMKDRGICVCFGTDGAASNNQLSVLRELQTAAILHKGVLRDPEAVKARDLVPMATRNGALSQGRTDCGLMEKGYCADLILVDTESMHNRPVFGAADTLAYSVYPTDILLTMADGHILYENGNFLTLDMERLSAEAGEVLRHYFE